MTINEEYKSQNEQLYIKNQKIEDNEQLLLKVMENYPNSYISIIDKDFKIKFTAGQEFKTKRRKSKDFIGLDLNIFFKKNADFFKKNFLKSFQGEEVQFEFKTRKDLYYIYKTVPLKNKENKINQILVVAENITKQKKSIEQIEKLSIAVEQSANSIVITDTNGNIEYVNQEFVNNTGYSKNEAIGQNSRILKTDVHSDEIYKNLWDTINSGKTWKGEFCNKKKNGELFWESSNITPIKNKKGEVYNYVAVKNDITEKRLLNIKLKKQKNELQIKNNKITASINYAQSIQSAMLPEEYYLKQFLPENFILYLPRDIVSGDFYWVKQVNHQIIITVADCTGHGVPGAFMSMLGIAFLNEIVANLGWKSEIEPDKILKELRLKIKKALFQNEGKKNIQHNGMDMAICILDLENRTLQYSGANMPFCLMRKNQLGTYEINFHKADKMPIGKYPKEKDFTNKNIILNDDDIIYMFSDGFADQFGGKKNRKFLTKNFKELLLKHCEKDLLEQKEVLRKTFEIWKKNNKQIDDILVLGFKIPEDDEVEFFM